MWGPGVSTRASLRSRGLKALSLAERPASLTGPSTSHSLLEKQTCTCTLYAHPEPSTVLHWGNQTDFSPRTDDYWLMTFLLNLPPGCDRGGAPI